VDKSVDNPVDEPGATVERRGTGLWTVVEADQFRAADQRKRCPPGVDEKEVGQPG
jgi:hypothetical protein